LNAGNWVVYKTVLGLESETVSSFALQMFVIVAVASVLFIAIELWRTRVIKLRLRSILSGIVVLLAAALVIVGVKEVLSRFDPATIGKTLQLLVAAAGALVIVIALADIVRTNRRNHAPTVRWYAYLIPIVPLVLILVYELSFVAAFMIGLAYGILVTYRRGVINLTSRALIEGSASVVPAVVLMIGIGMLLSAILGPTKIGPGKYWHDAQAAANVAVEWPVLADMKPMLETIVPGSLVAYVLTFTLLAPFALYRGPLNVWGLGYGVGGILLATGVPAGAVMGVLMSLGTIQGASDPTNTANVWIANEVRMDVTTLMWRTLPYAWVAAIVGLVVAGVQFF
ncbi:MAG: citrate transporter, partial [Ignavibacteriae bacterium]|nr:citrate transporter [Ignavibacteriota bacterium]